MELPLFITKWKIASLVSGCVFLAAVDTQTSSRSAEDYTVKGLLVVAVSFLVRQLLKERQEYQLGREVERKEFRQDMQNLSAKHAEAGLIREDKLHEVCGSVLKHIEAGTTATEKQTEWFEGVGRDLMTQGMAKKRKRR